MSEARRPSPDEILSRVRAAAGKAQRGHCRIFLGMAPGVGKTFAMLTAAQRLARDGVDVVVGVVETHGRSETERLLLGLDILSRRRVDYRGATLEEFDLEAALLRRPAVVVVDELAHSNVPGSRFGKRWQDVDALLDAGIDVLTTLNVQHIESLNDVVRQVTGVEVREVVPDSVVDRADEVELVDLPPDALLERLQQGKVYLPESARAAQGSFFRRENLTALRELALRRTAEWVDARMGELKSERGIPVAWPTSDRVLVAVSPSPLAPTVVRAARRIAAGMRAQLVAVYVETPASSRLPAEDRERVRTTLSLAERLGADTVTLTGSDAAREMVAFARGRNVSRIVLGKTARSRWSEIFRGSFVQEVIRLSGDIDVHVVRGDGGAASSDRLPVELAEGRGGQALLAIAVVGLTTLVSATWLRSLDITNIAMIFLVAVVVVSVAGRRFATSLAAFLSVAAFDFFFVPPALTFAVSDVQYLITFVAMLVVGLLVAQLTANFRRLAESARNRSMRTGELYAMSRGLASARTEGDVAAIGAARLRDSFRADAAVLVARHDGKGLEILGSAGSPDWIDERELAVAAWAHQHGAPAGVGSNALPAARGRHIPIAGPRGAFGVLSIRPVDRAAFLGADAQSHLGTCADQIALALERIRLLDANQQALLDADRERLRSSLLSSVSHDLRTPLASIAGAASTLLDASASLDEATRTELVRGIAEESDRLSDLVSDLVFATRLEAGGVDPRREWTTVEEVVGSGIARLSPALSRRSLKTIIPSDLPLIRVDAVMMSQAIHNLVDNAIRHTPESSPIEIAAWLDENDVMIEVRDEGPGLDPDEIRSIFNRFYRGSRGRASGSGLGLGLTVCRGVVEAHGGRIWAHNLGQGMGSGPGPGAAFTIALPYERDQPTVPTDEERP
jgi:two-component system sensor histidine kinase KdpD